jgi:hypothetical protein
MSDQEPIPDPVPGTTPPRASEPSSGPAPELLNELKADGFTGLRSAAYSSRRVALE